MGPQLPHIPATPRLCRARCRLPAIAAPNEQALLSPPASQCLRRREVCNNSSPPGFQTDPHCPDASRDTGGAGGTRGAERAGAGQPGPWESVQPWCGEGPGRHVAGPAHDPTAQESHQRAVGICVTSREWPGRPPAAAAPRAHPPAPASTHRGSACTAFPGGLTAPRNGCSGMFSGFTSDTHSSGRERSPAAAPGVARLPREPAAGWAGRTLLRGRGRGRNAHRQV